MPHRRGASRSSAIVAVGVSGALHVGLAAALIFGRINSESTKPQIQLAYGEQAARPTVSFITNEQLEQMLRPKPPNLRSTQPVRPVQVQPLPVTAQTQEVTVEPVDVQPRPQYASGVNLPRYQPATQLYSEPAQPPQVVLTTEPVNPAEPAVASPAQQTVAVSAQKVGVNRDVSVTNLPTPEYPAKSRRLGEQGLVILSAMVHPDGRVDQIQVVKAPAYPRLIAAAKSAMAKAQFGPAMANGRPIAQRVEVPFRFKLR